MLEKEQIEENSEEAQKKKKKDGIKIELIKYGGESLTEEK